MSPAQSIQASKANTSLFQKGMDLAKRFPVRGKMFLTSFGALALTVLVLSVIAFPFLVSETTLKAVGGFVVNIVASFVALVIALSITIIAIGILAIGFGYPPSKWNFSPYKDKALLLVSSAREYLSTLRSST